MGVPCRHGFCYHCAAAWTNNKRCDLCKKEISVFLHKLYGPQDTPLVDMPVRLIPIDMPGLHRVKEYEEESRFIRDEISFAEAAWQAVGCSRMKFPKKV